MTVFMRCRGPPSTGGAAVVNRALPNGDDLVEVRCEDFQ
jgi:hypothetical protein